MTTLLILSLLSRFSLAQPPEQSPDSPVNISIPAACSGLKSQMSSLDELGFFTGTMSHAFQIVSLEILRADQDIQALKRDLDQGSSKKAQTHLTQELKWKKCLNDLKSKIVQACPQCKNK